jgi:STE24 endopeptidase
VARRRSRLPLAVLGAVVVAEAAVLLLRPRDGVISPAPVETRSYFSASELDRARDYRRPQLALSGVEVAIQIGVLVFLLRRPPGALLRARRRPLVAGALAGVALSAGLVAATLPVAAVMRQRSLDAGLATQSWGGWAVDVAKSTGIGAVMSGAGAALLLALMRRFPRHWWLPASGTVVAVGVVLTYAGPVVLEPIFNRFERLPQGPTRTDVVELARRAGVKVGEVYEVDASRRTTTANAYVAGLGRTKRVVLYDNLLWRFDREEARIVVAHELAHVHYRDVPMGLLYLALVAPAGMFGVQQLTRRLAPGGGTSATPAVLPAAALSLSLMVVAVTLISNQLSRRVEARADSYSLKLTDAPKPFIASERRLALQNLSDPDPPDWQEWLRTHPPTIERIGIGVAYERGSRP